MPNTQLMLKPLVPTLPMPLFTRKNPWSEFCVYPSLVSFYYHMYVSQTLYYLISLVLSLYVNGIMPETCFYSVTSHL